MSKPRIHIAQNAGPRAPAPEIGSGPPLLLLHGVARNGRDFRPLLPWLSDRPLAIWDHRGHGLSGRAQGQYRVCDYADDVIDWLDRCEFDQVDLYGHSLGALVALKAAAQAPAKVRSLILEDPPSPGFLDALESTGYYFVFAAMQRLADSDASVESIAAQLAATRLGTDDEAPLLGEVRDAASLRFTARCLQSVDPDVFTPLLAGQWLEGYDFEASLESVRCPTLLMHGDVLCGGMLPATDVAAMRQRLRLATCVRFEGAGHLLHWQRLEETVRYVLSFLESL